MLTQIGFWLYLVNITLLILHEMDSAFWKEWELFHLPGGLAGFLLLHFPLYLIGLYGLVLAWRGVQAGLVFSLVIAAAGIFAFAIHSYFLAKGGREFNAPVSKLVLSALLVASIAQMAIAIIGLIS